MKKYRTGGHKALIEVVEVERETKKSIWLKRGEEVRRIGKVRRGVIEYWDTIEEAKQHLIQEFTTIINKSERNIQEAKANLEALKQY